MADIKPTAFKNGVPKEQYNGLFGLEEELIADPGTEVLAIVRYRVEEVVEKHLADETYPVVAAVQIEPLRTADAIKKARALLEAAYKKRTSEGALDLPEVEG